MTRARPLAAALLAAAALGGCAQQGLYSWGNYDTAMYQYARDETAQPAFQAALLSVIETNEASGKRMPPGIYAEYGYQLLEQSKTGDAIVFFEKEKQTWAESGPFMDTMIAYAKGGRQLRKAEVAEAAPAGEAK